MELKDKIGHLGGVAAQDASEITRKAGGGSTMSDALSALCNLGYSDPVAREALAAVKHRLGDEPFAQLGLQEMIREGLKALA